MRISIFVIIFLVSSCDTGQEKTESNKLNFRESTPSNNSPKYQETTCEIERIKNYSEINNHNLDDSLRIDVRSCLYDENKVQIILDNYDLIKSTKIKSSLFQQLVLYMPSHVEIIDRYWRHNGGTIISDVNTVNSKKKQSSNFDFGLIFGSTDFGTFRKLSEITKKKNTNKKIINNRLEIWECQKEIKSKDFGQRYFMSLPLIENDAILDSMIKDTSNLYNSKEIVFAYLSYFKYKLLFENPITVDFDSLSRELSKFKLELRMKSIKIRN